MTSRTARIAQLLENGLEPTHLTIRDDSAKHAGHAGARPEGETHLHLVIVSRKFEGLSRLERHRLVLGLLHKEFDQGLHAVSIEAREA